MLLLLYDFPDRYGGCLIPTAADHQHPLYVNYFPLTCTKAINVLFYQVSMNTMNSDFASTADAHYVRIVSYASCHKQEDGEQITVWSVIA